MTPQSVDSVPDESNTGPAAPPRAGRNLPAAIGVGVGVGVLALVLLRWLPPGFLALIAVAVTAAGWELQVVLRATGRAQLALAPLALGVAATVVTTWWWGHTAQILGLVGTTLAIMFVRLFGGASDYLRDTSVSVFVAAYLGGLGSFAVLLLVSPDGTRRMLLFLIMVVCSDTGGYLVGALIGRHPLASRISPKKSWEGLGGSVITASLASAIAAPLLLPAHWWQGAIMGAVIALVATAGDLAESQIKRDLGVKDMGQVLPGHGGVMDRLDSLLPCAAASWMLLTALIPA